MLIYLFLIYFSLFHFCLYFFFLIIFCFVFISLIFYLPCLILLLYCCSVFSMWGLSVALATNKKTSSLVHICVWRRCSDNTWRPPSCYIDYNWELAKNCSGQENFLMSPNLLFSTQNFFHMSDDELTHYLPVLHRRQGDRRRHLLSFSRLLSIWGVEALQWHGTTSAHLHTNSFW